jgi:hypothetical protein
MKRARVILGVCVLLLVLASVAATLSQPSSVDAARAAAVGAGWRAEGLVLLGYRGTGTLFNQRETVEFLVQGAQPPKTVRVELHKPVYFLGWQVVDVREEAQAGPR